MGLRDGSESQTQPVAAHATARVLINRPWVLRYVARNRSPRLLLRRFLLVAPGAYILPLGRFAAGKFGALELVVKHQRFLLPRGSAFSGIALLGFVLRAGELRFN